MRVPTSLSVLLCEGGRQDSECVIVIKNAMTQQKGMDCKERKTLFQISVYEGGRFV